MRRKCAELAQRARSRRDRIRRIRAMDRRSATRRVQGAGRQARHEGRALSRRRRRRAVRRLRCLERAGGDLAPSRASARRPIRSTPPARTGASPASMPPASRCKSFEPFREMLRASMRHAGAIRLDHVLGLKRLYLVPRGFAAARTAPMCRCRSRRCWRSTALESVANRCVVIGEDLGTVPEGFREQMPEWGIWSYLVMMFERDDARRVSAASITTCANALVTFNTHDLSTYAGWRSFGDLKLKRSLGIDPGESDDARWHALPMLDEMLRQHGIDQQRPLFASREFLARTPSRLMAISLEDLLGVVDQPNIPGTVNEHPNWRQRLPVAVDEIATAIDVAALKAATRERARLRSVVARIRRSVRVRTTIALQDRRLRPDRRLRDRRAGRPRRLDRLAVLAGLRFRRLLCRAARHPQERPLADRAGGRSQRRPRAAIGTTR